MRQREGMTASQSARLTIEFGERMIQESKGDDIDAIALAVTVAGYICRRLGHHIPPAKIAYTINNFPSIASVRECAQQDMN